jgi:hypothetical protein
MTARAGAVADHAHIRSDEVQRIRTELGPKMDDFEADDDAVHQSAIRLHAAAEAGHMEEILQELDWLFRESRGSTRSIASCDGNHALVPASGGMLTFTFTGEGQAHAHVYGQGLRVPARSDRSLRPALRPPVRRLTVPVHGPVNVPCGPDPAS